MEPNWAEIREDEFPSPKIIIHLKSTGGSPISKSLYESEFSLMIVELTYDSRID